MKSSMLGTKPETVRKRGEQTGEGSVEKEAMTLNELRNGRLALTHIKMLACAAGDLTNSALWP